MNSIDDFLGVFQYIYEQGSLLLLAKVLSGLLVAMLAGFVISVIYIFFFRDGEETPTSGYEFMLAPAPEPKPEKKSKHSKWCRCEYCGANNRTYLSNCKQCGAPLPTKR